MNGEVGIVARSETISTLVAKCAKIMREVGPIEHDAKNVSQGWEYTSYNAISGRLRDLMGKEEVVAFPCEEKSEVVRTIKGKTSEWAVVKATMIYHVAEASKGEWIELRFSGEGADPGDKALPKAQTMCDKYLLKVLFRVSTGGEEPEDAEAEDQEGEQEIAEEEVETVSDEQLADLLSLIEKADADRAKFLKYFQINDVGDLPAADYERAAKALKATLEAKKKGGAKK